MTRGSPGLEETVITRIFRGGDYSKKRKGDKCGERL